MLTAETLHTTLNESSMIDLVNGVSSTIENNPPKVPETIRTATKTRRIPDISIVDLVSSLDDDGSNYVDTEMEYSDDEGDDQVQLQQIESIVSGLLMAQESMSPKVGTPTFRKKMLTVSPTPTSPPTSKHKNKISPHR